MEDIDADLDERSETQQTNEMLYNSWEQDCISTIENGADIDKHLSREQDVNAQKLWTTYQNANSSVSQLFKVSQSNEDRSLLWKAFQQASTNVISLYRDGSENQKTIQDLQIKCGVQKNKLEVLAWAKKQKHSIKREDLISFLSGRTKINNPSVTKRNPDGISQSAPVETIVKPVVERDPIQSNPKLDESILNECSRNLKSLDLNVSNESQGSNNSKAFAQSSKTINDIVDTVSKDESGSSKKSNTEKSNTIKCTPDKLNTSTKSSSGTDWERKKFETEKLLQVFSRYNSQLKACDHPFKKLDIWQKIDEELEKDGIKMKSNIVFDNELVRFANLMMSSGGRSVEELDEKYPLFSLYYNLKDVDYFWKNKLGRWRKEFDSRLPGKKKPQKSCKILDQSTSSKTFNESTIPKSLNESINSNQSLNVSRTSVRSSKSTKSQPNQNDLINFDENLDESSGSDFVTKTVDGLIVEWKSHLISAVIKNIKPSKSFDDLAFWEAVAKDHSSMTRTSCKRQRAKKMFNKLRDEYCALLKTGANYDTLKAEWPFFEDFYKKINFSWIRDEEASNAENLYKRNSCKKNYGEKYSPKNSFSPRKIFQPDLEPSIIETKEEHAELIRRLVGAVYNVLESEEEIDYKTTFWDKVAYLMSKYHAPVAPDASEHWKRQFADLIHEIRSNQGKNASLFTDRDILSDFRVAPDGSIHLRGQRSPLTIECARKKATVDKNESNKQRLLFGKNDEGDEYGDDESEDDENDDEDDYQEISDIGIEVDEGEDDENDTEDSGEQGEENKSMALEPGAITEQQRLFLQYFKDVYNSSTDEINRKKFWKDVKKRAADDGNVLTDPSGYFDLALQIYMKLIRSKKSYEQACKKWPVFEEMHAFDLSPLISKNDRLNYQVLKRLFTQPRGRK